MPNWATNKVTIVGPTEQLNKFLEDFKSSGYYKMNNIYPNPLWNADGTYVEGATHPNDWASNHWGTKWDFGTLLFDSLTELPEGISSFIAEYSTAWSPNVPFWEYVTTKYPELEVNLKYYEEGMAFIGEADIFEGASSDNSEDLTNEIYLSVGAKYDEDGNLDGDCDFDLFDYFKD